MPDQQMPPSPAATGSPPMGSGAMSVPSGSPGVNANAIAMVREAYKILAEALPKLPVGTPLANDLLSTLKTLGKHAPPSSEVPGVQQTALRGIAQDGQRNAMLDQVMKSLGSPAGGAGGAPGGAATPPGASMPAM
jgi:hypothetical protein